MKVGDWYVRLMVRLIGCQIILTANSPENLLICHSLAIHLLVLVTFAFWLNEVRQLLLALALYGGTLFFFLKNLCFAHCLSLLFHQLACLGSFPACWKQTNVSPIPKGPSSSSVSNYWEISITPVLANAFELIFFHLEWFMELNGLLQPPSCLLERSGYLWCTLCVSHTLRSAFENGQEARIVKIFFSAVFDRVPFLWIHYKLCTVGILSSVLTILVQFL